MIISFKDKCTEDIYNGIHSKDSRKIPGTIWRIAARKLDMINASHELRDLLAPPGNKLEALKRQLAGFHSIRINDQYRIIFKWTKGNAETVKIVDYH